MPLYFWAHTTAWLTKQALRELMQDLLAASEVKVHRAVSSQLGGRMLTEVEALEQPTLQKFPEARRINCQWIMRIDLDVSTTGITEY